MTTGGAALVIGIDYSDYARQGRMGILPGCTRDARNVAQFLQRHRGFAPGEVTVLHDADGAAPQELPTKSNILRALEGLVAKARAGVVRRVYVTYSGHGAGVRDDSGDELDGQDEVLVPSDFLERGFVRDDELHRIFVARMPVGVQVHVVTDCCHSGTLLDLPWKYDAARGRLQLARRTAAPTGGASIVTLSGCMDSQTASSAYNLERKSLWQGALTWAWLSAMERRDAAAAPSLARPVTSARRQRIDARRRAAGLRPMYGTPTATPAAAPFDWLACVRSLLRGKGFSQYPVLCCSHRLSPEVIRAAF